MLSRQQGQIIDVKNRKKKRRFDLFQPLLNLSENICNMHDKLRKDT